VEMFLAVTSPPVFLRLNLATEQQLLSHRRRHFISSKTSFASPGRETGLEDLPDTAARDFET
jgi:hypothetical protein